MTGERPSLRNDRPYPFCPGCGHGPILDALDAALVRRGADPARVVIVTDIGCSGLSDQYFDVSAFHGLHGRAITYAGGIKLARPDLDVIVVTGDGGTGIGGAHLLSAARRNIGITVIVFNNFNFGMTGGQHSSTTPTGALTPTTWAGNLERPLDICATAAANGAGFAYRGTADDGDLPARIAEAMDSGGFAVLDVWELCTAYFVRSNKYSRRSIAASLDEIGLPTGVVHREDRPEYATAYRDRHHGQPAPPGPPAIDTRFQSTLSGRRALLVAGAAGGRVRSATRLAGRAAIAAGLWAAQRDDYPVTVKTGHSVSTLILGPEPIEHVGVACPDVLLLLAPEGLAWATPALQAMSEDELVLAESALLPLATAAPVVELDFDRAEGRLAATDRSLAGVAAAVAHTGLFPMEAMIDVAAAEGRRPERTVAAIEAGAAMVAVR